MTDTFFRISIACAVLVLLAGCSFTGEFSANGQHAPQRNNVQASAEKPDPLQVCSPDQGAPFHFRKNILVAGTIGVSDLARDLPGLANLTSRRLQTHLESLEHFNVLATHDTSFESMAPGTAKRVRHLGREHASQFVVKLELEDLTMHSSGGWLRKMSGGRAQRNVLMKLYIYGTEYGAQLHSQIYQDTATGKVVGHPGRGNAVTTPWFKTDLGRKVDQILKAMSTQINEKLACIPFSTEVTAVEGNNIHISAGYLHGIRPGETLRVYRSNDLLAPDEIRKLSENEGWITVTTVFPNRSIATATQVSLIGTRPDIGDVVRAW